MVVVAVLLLVATGACYLYKRRRTTQHQLPVFNDPETTYNEAFDPSQQSTSEYEAPSATQRQMYDDAGTLHLFQLPTAHHTLELTGAADATYAEIDPLQNEPQYADPNLLLPNVPPLSANDGYEMPVVRNPPIPDLDHDVRTLPMGNSIAAAYDPSLGLDIDAHGPDFVPPLHAEAKTGRGSVVFLDGMEHETELTYADAMHQASQRGREVAASMASSSQPDQARNVEVGKSIALVFDQGPAYDQACNVEIRGNGQTRGDQDSLSEEEL